MAAKNFERKMGMAQSNTDIELNDDIDILLDTIDRLFEEEGIGEDTDAPEEKEIFSADRLKQEGYSEPQIEEILEGYAQKIDPSAYMDKRLNWKQMREIRLGLVDGSDVSVYNNIFFSAGQMQEIRLGLDTGIDVSSYARHMYATTDMRNMRLKLSENYYAANPEAFEKKVFDNDTGLTLIMSSDSMKAYVVVTEKTKPGLLKQHIVKMLNLYGITYGYIEAGISEVEKSLIKNKKICVASGTKNAPGRSGYYELFFENKKPIGPVMLDDGSVDYTQKVEENVVQKGQLLVKYHRAKRGESGRTVTNFYIKGELGEQKPELKGHGIEFDEDSSEYRAAEEGYIFYDEDSCTLNVWKSYIIDGDVNFNNGKIDVDGRLHIKGSVEDGADVKAKGDIIIDGYVAGAFIEAEQDIVIHSGVNANGKGKIKAGGSVNGKFFENASVVAKGDVYGSYYMNCQICTDGKVIAWGNKSKIMGGSIKAAVGVEAAFIGAYMSSSVFIDVGNKVDIEIRDEQLKKQYDHIKVELSQLLNGKKKIESGLGSEELKKSSIYKKTIQAIEIKNSQKEELIHERERMKNVLRAADGAYLNVKVQMQQDSRVILGNRPMRFSRDIKHTRITKQK